MTFACDLRSTSQSPRRVPVHIACERSTMAEPASVRSELFVENTLFQVVLRIKQQAQPVAR